MKKGFTFLACLFPSKLAILFLKIIGHTISWKSKIGFSFVFAKALVLEKNSKIGHFNIIKIDKIRLGEGAYIGHLNVFNGPFSINFDTRGAVGNSNIISRAPLGVTYGESTLKIGELSKITARHTIDLTKNISLGKFSTIAGASTQVWTHGYIHAKKGKDRIRIDGEIHIKDNVYIGSNCVMNAGVTINNAITVGSNSTISKDLVEPGMYVGQKLRFLEKNIDDVKAVLTKVDLPNLVENVYQK
jgi:acetyltransferase-like isoleucine patch superfamily enzyme